MNSQELYKKLAPDYYDYIVVDEFHHASAPTYQRFLNYFKPKILLGLTATPERMDGANISDYFDNRIAADKIGDQAIEKTQNKTMAESQKNGVEVHLFEVYEPGKYTYSGVVEQAGKPYQETQLDDNGNPRKVWIFLLKKISEVKVDPDATPKTTLEPKPPE